jgi:hypothetical protein
MQEIEGILGDRDSKKIRYATRAVRVGDGVGIQHHDTVVIVYAPDGTITLDPRGWHTNTTKERLNNWLPKDWYVYQKDHVWYLWRSGENSEEFVFSDGMQILPDGTVIGAGDADEQKELASKVLDYVKRFMAALEAGDVPRPSRGDCWHCLMTTEEGKSLGEMTGAGHLLSHIEEQYYVPSLLMRACRVMGISQIGGSAVWEMMSGGYPDDWMREIALRQAKSCLKRYMYRELGLGA